MTVTHFLIEAFFAIAGVVACFVLWRAALRWDFENGRMAYRDGLPLNPGWTRACQEGWWAERGGR